MVVPRDAQDLKPILEDGNNLALPPAYGGISPCPRHPYRLVSPALGVRLGSTSKST